MSNTAPNHIKSVSVDPEEMAHFAAMADEWWDPSGKFKPLHIMNGCRTEFVKEQICEHFMRDPNAELPFKGLSILDIGCGGGLLCEPMARMGAKVTGIDALKKNVKTAQVHADEAGLDINYQYGTVESMVADKLKPYDVVLNMEVIEHVNNPANFMKDCAHMVRGGGMLFCSTINRTAKAFWLAIFGAEYVMKWLPVGTHQYNKFITPPALIRMLKDAGLAPNAPQGMTFNPLNQTWKISDDTGVNYVVTSVKE
ncbi:MAG: bifunctional 2-polyprenyl-6-hydroxyphenol methylase/3-demethylubiquinol 3-O-methyltransferase UbiG [Robiginitomaculum sp.]